MARVHFCGFLCSLVICLSLSFNSLAFQDKLPVKLPLRSRRLVFHRDFWKTVPELNSVVRDESSPVDPFIQYEGNGNNEGNEMQEASDTVASDPEVKVDTEAEDTQEQPKEEEEADAFDTNDSDDSDDQAQVVDPADSTNANETDTAPESGVSESGVSEGANEDSVSEVESRDGSEPVAPDSGISSLSADNSSNTEESSDQSVSQPSNATESAADEDSSTLLSNTTGGNNDTNAFMAFKLRHMVETDSTADEAFHLVTIFEEGKFSGPFSDSPSSTNIDAVSSSETEKWYMESAYADRISFRLDYTPDSSDYKISEPVIAVSSETGIQPVLQDFQNDPENGEGSFSVLYRCLSEGPEESYISLHMQVTGSHSFDTAWKKVCGRGRHEHMEFGFTSHDLGTVLFNKDGTYGKDEQRILEIGPMDTSTELTMKLTPPAYTLDFKDPFIISNSDYVSVALRGTVAGGTVTSDGLTKFSVLYECQATAIANIAFSVAIPPWDNMTAVWRKDCGGKSSQSLLIGTTGPGSYEVVHEGEVNLQYNITENTYIGDVQDVAEVIPGNTDYKKFYITNSDDTSDIHVQTLSMTMSDPSVVSPTIQTSLVASSSYLSTSGGVIGRKETKSLYLHFICKKEGKSLILVTLPILRYRNIEFGFLKECFEPKIHRHSGFLQTAGSIMEATLLLAIVGCGAGWVYYRRRSRNVGKKYAAVPTSERGLP
ncbi:unnamed protein product [Agarophyton chilense]|eukprot:gb/GEZJ01000122.1/.p1 GENE.gb/GEZJ01000122.1/~~gb/GEZJ01000122.1/.p1  ORF type:complete len:714 (-),score=94.35 gb/GEZJ01000122.1/:4530-6671(-)